MKKIYPLLALFISCSSPENRELGYTPFSGSTIHINIQSDLTDTLFAEVFMFTNIPRDGKESPIITITEAGNYYLNFEVDRPAKSILTVGGDRFHVFVFPNDTSPVSMSLTEGKPIIGFNGASSVMNEYYLEKKNALGYTDIRIPLNKPLTSKATYKRIKSTTDSTIHTELLFLKKYSASVPLPEWFLDYEHAEIIYAGAAYKTFLPHANEIMNYFKDSLPGNYFDFLDHVEINNPKAVLSSSYFGFLDDYFAKDLPVNEFKDLSGFERHNKFTSHKLSQSRVQLSGQVKELYHMNNFSSSIQYYTDSLAIDSLAREFQLTDYKSLARISGTKARTGHEIQMLNLHKGDTIPDFILVNELDSLISIRDFRHEVIYINFWATWCGPCIKNIPELNKLISYYQGDSRIKFLNVCLDSQQDQWLTSIAKHKLKGINLMAQGNWNAKMREYFAIKGIPQYAILVKGNVLFENFTDKAPQVQHKIDLLLSDEQ